MAETSSSTRRAWPSKRSPATVGTAPRLVRWSNRASSSRSRAATDRIGLALAVTLEFLGPLAVALAACCAAYIVLNRVVGVRLPGLQGPAAATAVCSLAYLPVLVSLAANGRLGSLPLLYAVAAGLLSSVVPYAADLTALRYVPTRFFGVFMSCHPVLAALAGLALLGQLLALHEWLGIALVVTANAAAVATQAPSRRRHGVDDVPTQHRVTELVEV